MHDVYNIHNMYNMYDMYDMYNMYTIDNIYLCILEYIHVSPRPCRRTQSLTSVRGLKLLV